MAGDTYELEVVPDGFFKLSHELAVVGTPRNRSKHSFNLTPAKAEIILDGQPRGFITLTGQHMVSRHSDPYFQYNFDPVVSARVGLSFTGELDDALWEELKAGVCVLKCATIEVDKEAEAARKAEDFKKLQARRKVIMDELERKKRLND